MNEVRIGSQRQQPQASLQVLRPYAGVELSAQVFQVARRRRQGGSSRRRRRRRRHLQRRRRHRRQRRCGIHAGSVDNRIGGGNAATREKRITAAANDAATAANAATATTALDDEFLHKGLRLIFGFDEVGFCGMQIVARIRLSRPRASLPATAAAAPRQRGRRVVVGGRRPRSAASAAASAAAAAAAPNTGRGRRGGRAGGERFDGRNSLNGNGRRIVEQERMFPKRIGQSGG